MNDIDPKNLETILAKIRDQADGENIRVTQHALQEMTEEDITLDQVLEAIATGQTIQNIREALVVCFTVAHGAIVHYTLCVQQHNQY